VGLRPRFLILGNMPSAMSISAQQYYGNPRNTFWRIAGELFGFEPTSPYLQRIEALQSRGVALWDVLRSCRRHGSLDSAVEPASMVPNDIHTLLNDHPSIDRIYFNGSAAERNFARLVTIDGDAISFTRLPSTSPAHTISYAQKLAAWRVISS